MTRRAEMTFTEKMKEDFSNKEDWENPTLERYLEAMELWVEQMDAYYLNSNQSVSEQPTWKILADILYASKIYE